MDNLETHDERILIPETCFSIEPGIYFRDRFGVRSEIDVYISKEKEVIVPGLPIQETIINILQDAAVSS
jgi:Xaa-Pro aminopeptidase